MKTERDYFFKAQREIWAKKAFLVNNEVYELDEEGDWIWDTAGCFICFKLNVSKGMEDKELSNVLVEKFGSFFPETEALNGLKIANKPSIFVEGEFGGFPSANECFLASKAGRNFVASVMRRDEKESKQYEGKFLNPHNKFWDANPKNGMI